MDTFYFNFADNLEQRMLEIKKMLTNGFTIGVWEYRPKQMSIFHHEFSYWISVERLTNSAEILDWLAQIRGKTWADSKAIGDLLEMINTLIPLQQYVCGNGVGKKIDPVEIINSRRG